MSARKPKPRLVLNYIRFAPFKRPVIRVDLLYKKQEISAHAMIDSGADQCIFTAEFGEALGIDISSGKPVNIGGIASDTNGKPKAIIGYRHPIGLRIKNETRNIEAVFSKDYAILGYGLLGQIGFFDKFRSITFDYNSGKIIIQT